MDTYVAVGIPAGKIGSSKRQYVIHHEELIGLPDIGYMLWCSFLNVNSVDKALTAFSQASESQQNIVKLCMDELIQNKILVQLNETINLSLVRQGVGLGLDDSSGNYIVLCDQQINMSFLSYAIWCYSDGKKRLNDINNILKKQKSNFSNRELFGAFLQLLKTDALALQ